MGEKAGATSLERWTSWHCPKRGILVHELERCCTDINPGQSIGYTILNKMEKAVDEILQEQVGSLQGDHVVNGYSLFDRSPKKLLLGK